MKEFTEFKKTRILSQSLERGSQSETGDADRRSGDRPRVGRWIAIGLPYLWLLLFFLLPFVIVLQISLAEPVLAQPPYSALLAWVDESVLQLRLNLASYLLLLEDDLYLAALLNSLWVAFVCTLLCLLIGILYSYLPFMILPLYANLSRLDSTLLEAAADLGCRPARTFLRVTLPLSLPGILAGSMLVFIPAVGEFVIPDLLGGPDSLMVGRLLWTEFFANKDWPLASALAIVLLMLMVIPFVAMQRWQMRIEGGR